MIDWSQALISGLVSGVVGGLAVLVASLLGLKVYGRLAFFVGAVVVSTFGVRGWYNAPERQYDRGMEALIERTPSTAMDRHLRNWARGAKESKAIKDWFLKTPDMAPAARQQSMTQITSRGLKRLDDETLLSRAGLMRHMVEHVDTPLCAALGRGDLNPERLNRALETLSEEQLRAYSDMSIRATEAELLQTRRATPVFQKDIQQALEMVWRVLPQQDGERFESIRRNLDKASDEDVCWLMRKAHEQVFVVPQPYNVWLAMALVQD